MRTFRVTLIGVFLLTILGLGGAEAINIQVREVRREVEADGLLLVYEIRNASVDPWDFRRLEVHIFDQTERRIELLRPVSALSRLEREDVEFVQTRIPPTLLPDAHRLELRVFVQEVLGFPVADPPLKRLVYSFPVRPQASPPLFRSRGTLWVEPAGMVESPGRPRAIFLRVINQGRETLSDVILLGEINGMSGPPHKIQIPVTPKRLSPGAEAYVSLTIPQAVLGEAKGFSLQAYYLKGEEGRAFRYVEDLEIHPKGVRPRPRGLIQIPG
jgi:hypothetical protein